LIRVEGQLRAPTTVGTINVLARRPFMSDHLEMVKTAISNPTFGIYSDAHHADRYIYYYLHPTKLRYLKVVTREQVDHLVVITAFYTDSTKSGEKLIWTQANAS
jgi:hypothetical protein